MKNFIVDNLEGKWYLGGIVWALIDSPLEEKKLGMHVQQIRVTVVVYKDYTLRVTSAGLSEQ